MKLVGGVFRVQSGKAMPVHNCTCSLYIKNNSPPRKGKDPTKKVREACTAILMLLKNGTAYGRGRRRFAKCRPPFLFQVQSGGNS